MSKKKLFEEYGKVSYRIKEIDRETNKLNEREEELNKIEGELILKMEEIEIELNKLK